MVKNKQTGSIIVSTVVLVFLLSLLGITLQQFLRGQVRDQYGLRGDATGAFNIPLDDAYKQAGYMAEFGLNWVIWEANNQNAAPGAAPIPLPTTGPSPFPDFTSNPVNGGYADPDKNMFPEPPLAPTPTPAVTASPPNNYIKSYTVEDLGANRLKVTGYAYITDDTQSASPPARRVARVIYAEWALNANGYYLRKSTWGEDSAQ